jgi:uncharacterized membrane protein (DUF373 family)
MFNYIKNLMRRSVDSRSDEAFLHLVHVIENIVSKVLSIALLVVIFVSLVDLVVVLSKDLFSDPFAFFNKTLIEIFGLFLNILIALELQENITAYLKKHIVQVELVVTTALIAIARKLILFDFSKNTDIDLAALGFAILCLSVGYWLIKQRVSAQAEES